MNHYYIRDTVVVDVVVIVWTFIHYSIHEPVTSYLQIFYANSTVKYKYIKIHICIHRVCICILVNGVDLNNNNKKYEIKYTICL